MRRWSRLAAVCSAVGLILALSGCGQLFQVKGASSQPTLQELTQRVETLEAQVSELNAAMAGSGQNGAQTATSSGGANAAAARSGTGSQAQAVVTADYLNVHPQPDVSTPRVGVLKQNTAVAVIGTQGDWTQISFKNVQGWVETKFLKKSS